MKHKTVKHTNAHKMKPKLPKVADIEQPELKRMPAISGPRTPKPEPKPQPKIEPKSNTYTQADWEKEVAEHVPPGRPIPDWLAAKAPTG